MENVMIQVVLIKLHKKITLERLFKNIKRHYSSVEKVLLVFGRNKTGLKKLSSFVSTDKRLICLPKCHVSFKVRTVNIIFHFSYFDPD
jgi:hypothetical protein